MLPDIKSYLCSTCAFLDKGVCIMLKRNVPEPNKQFCDLHKKNVSACCCCGGLLPDSGVVDDGKLYCMDCYRQLGTCATCKNKCGLETDNSGIPKQVMGNFKMNGMQYQGPVANPVLIEKYCRTCKCNINNTCHRKTNTKCENYL